MVMVDWSELQDCDGDHPEEPDAGEHEETETVVHRSVTGVTGGK